MPSQCPVVTQLIISIIREQQQLSTFQVVLHEDGLLTGAHTAQEYVNLAQRWSQQGGGGKPGQVLELDAQGYAVWETLSGDVVGLD